MCQLHCLVARDKQAPGLCARALRFARNIFVHTARTLVCMPHVVGRMCMGKARCLDKEHGTRSTEHEKQTTEHKHEYETRKYCNHAPCDEAHRCGGGCTGVFDKPDASPQAGRYVAIWQNLNVPASQREPPPKWAWRKYYKRTLCEPRDGWWYCAECMCPAPHDGLFYGLCTTCSRSGTCPCARCGQATSHSDLECTLAKQNGISFSAARICCIHVFGNL